MSLYNDDELIAPAWINQEFLEKVLTEYENNGQVEIIKFNTSPASMKGDHYGSIMFRCKVEYRFIKNRSSTKRSLIIKTLPAEDNKKRELLMETGLFETEISMYAETLPKIERILAECGEPTKLAPSVFYHSLEPQKVIILEDLCELGYNTVRGRYLTEDEMKVVYQKVAKLHAVSYMLGHSEHPEVVTKYKEGFMNMSVPMMKDMTTSGLKNFIKLLSSREEFSVYAEKIKDMHDDLEQACKNLFNAHALKGGQGDIFVLNHGDFHMKNLMFKFNNANKLDDMIMVDYQISCYAPSSIDLLYSQFMLLSSDLRMKRLEFMQYYFTEFTRVLKKINYQGKLPKYSEFQMANLKYRHFAVFALAVLSPLVIGFLTKSAEELKEVDTAVLMENPNGNEQYYFVPAFVEEVRKIMPIFLREGYLD